MPPHERALSVAVAVAKSRPIRSAGRTAAGSGTVAVRHRFGAQDQSSNSVDHRHSVDPSASAAVAPAVAAVAVSAVSAERAQKAGQFVRGGLVDVSVIEQVTDRRAQVLDLPLRATVAEPV